MQGKSAKKNEREIERKGKSNRADNCPCSTGLKLGTKKK
jgi:hypothetical protein